MVILISKHVQGHLLKIVLQMNVIRVISLEVFSHDPLCNEDIYACSDTTFLVYLKDRGRKAQSLGLACAEVTVNGYTRHMLVRPS